MKELTIEEKAKRYDEVLAMAKECITYVLDDTVNKYMLNMFPELKESEDERIRKGIIRCVKCNMPDNNFRKKYIAWLEKQGEQKPYGQRDECMDCQFSYAGECKGHCAMKRGEQNPTNKVEPKFNVGDWITNGATKPAQISSIEDDMYYTHNGTIGGDIESMDKDYHLWTIQDAKDGDVLVDFYGNVCIYQEPSTNLMYHSHCYANNKRFYVLGGSHAISNTYPATKEQCDTLIKAMTNAGYTFDFEKKELKILNNNS